METELNNTASEHSGASPCSASCPKCGSTDIARKHQIPGDRRRTYSILRDSEHNTAYVEEDWYEGKCKKECIANVCRCCGYRWEVDPLPNNILNRGFI
jgi:hypothetical protein